MAAGKCIRPMSFPERDDGPVMLEYVMVDHTRSSFLTRMYVMDREPTSPQDVPRKYVNQYDSPAMETPCPELAMVPVALFRDPFRQGRHKIVLCVPEYPDKPEKTVVYNTRAKCVEFLDKVGDHEPWYGFEQEYYVVDNAGRPVDWDSFTPDIDWNGDICRGHHQRLERDLIETQLKACIYAGIKIDGMNRESSPSEWEYTIGPLEGVAAADHVVVARYILMRLAEMNDIRVLFDNPQCVRDTSARATLHLNFSTKATRASGGIEHIHRYIENIQKHNQKSIVRAYDLKDGAEMPWLLSGRAYMPLYDSFVAKVADKDLSTIRIPAGVAVQGRGYMEDRRPTANADPYEVTRVFTMSALFETNGF